MTFGIVIRARVAETAYVVITNLAGKDETYIEKRKQFDGDVGKTSYHTSTCQSSSSYAV